MKPKCDCDIAVLLEDYKRDPYFLRYTRWSDTSGFLFCDRHRVYVRIEHEAKRVAP